MFLKALWLAQIAPETFAMPRSPSQWVPFWPLLQPPLCVSFPRPGAGGGCRRHLSTYQSPADTHRHTTWACMHIYLSLTHHTLKECMHTVKPSAVGALTEASG